MMPSFELRSWLAKSSPFAPGIARYAHVECHSRIYNVSCKAWPRKWSRGNVPHIILQSNVRKVKEPQLYY